MLRRGALAIITVLALAGSAELIRLAASPASGQTPRPSPSQILGLRPRPKQLQPRKDRGHHKQSVKKSVFSSGSSVDVSSIFLQAPTYQTGGVYPYAMALTDVNRDGIPDMVVAQCVGSSCDGLVGVLLGKGDGTFQPAQTYSSGGYSPDGLVVADVNGDGNSDLVVANTCAGQSGGVCTGNGVVGILLGNGDGTFQPAQVLDTGALYATSVAAADVNGDGTLDLVVTNQCTTANDCAGLVAILLGNGGGSFQVAQHYSTGGWNTASVAVADVNGDGRLDVVAANRFVSLNDGSGTVSVLLGNGDGTLQAPQTYGSAGFFANAVVVVDVNGDAKLDLLVLNECTPAHRCDAESGSVGVLLGNGDGTFQAAQVSDSGAASPLGMTVADVNGDGKPDVLAASRFAIGDSSGNGAVSVLLSNGDGTFRTAHVYNSMGWTSKTEAAADVNGDGKLDVLVANWFLSGSDFTGDSVAVMLGHGDGSFQAAPIYNPGGAFGVPSATIADLNGDGKADLVVASECLSFAPCADGGVDILMGLGDGTFQPPQTYDSGGIEIQAVTTADVNGDGKLDLLVANQCLLGYSDCSIANGSAGVLLGNGDGTFQPAVSYDSAGSFANSIAVADVNGDGKLDLLVGNQCVSSADCTNGSITVLLGNGDGTFSAGQTFSSVGYWANSVLAADVNGDGNLDLLVADFCLTPDCTGNGQAAVLLGNGDGTFQSAQTYDSGSDTAHSLLVVDVNADGKPDLVVANTNSIGVLLGNGDGTFLPALLSSAENGYTGHLVAADFNGDGKLDIASSDGSLLLGNGDGTFAATTGFLPADLGIATGDLNGDGKPDLAIGGVTVLLNIAGQTFATATALTSSLNPSETGQDVTFTARVTTQGSGTPTGSVTFDDGATLLGTVPLANGVAALTVSDLNAGTHGITATYSGDTTFVASSSPVVSQVVNLAPAVINVTESIHVADSPDLLPAAMINVNESIHVTDAPALVKQQVTPTITWPAPAPITYGTPLSATQLNATANTAGTFVYTPPAGTVLAAGNQTLSVAFTPTDTANYTSANASVGLLVNQASTAVQLTSSANPQFVNQPITFTATITSPAAGSATGSVIFFAGTTNLGTVSVAGNTASLTTSFSTAGNRSITAQYSGDNNYRGSTSALLIQSVLTKTRPPLTLTSSLNPAFVGQAVTFTATFGSLRPADGESITFKRGAAVLGTGTILGGTASFTTSSLPVGTGKISANYAGNGIFLASSASLTQTVNLYPTTTSLASNLNPATYGQTVVLTSTVTTLDSAPPTGTVTFRNGGASLGTVTLGSDGIATLTVTSLPAGVLSLTAAYNGDARNAKSNSSTLSETINPAASTTTLTSSINPSRAGQRVKFSVSVSTSTGALAKGSVTFTAGSVTLGTVNLAGGKASISTSSLPPGANTITATYAGNANVTGSSATLTQQVN